MFYYLNGTVAEIAAGLAVIDCGGVGYACATTNYTLSQLKKGERARLYTYLHVREDIFELYGFASQQELNSFKMLIGVSGVGPKAALAILSATTPQNLALSIVTEDEKALTAAQGIGKKIAQRIILELKDKLAKEQSNFTVPSGGGSAASSSKGGWSSSGSSGPPEENTSSSTSAGKSISTGSAPGVNRSPSGFPGSSATAEVSGSAWGSGSAGASC